MKNIILSNYFVVILCNRTKFFSVLDYFEVMIESFWLTDVMEEVTVEQGILRGKHVHSDESGRCYFSFQGIPYAAPPVGPLRFRVS